MKRIIILGNGFDLDLKFPTAYKDFIDSPEFKSNLWSGGPWTFSNSSHPTNLFNYIQSKAAEEEEYRWTDIEKILSEYSRKGEISISTKGGKTPAHNVSSQEVYGYYEQVKESLKQYISRINFHEIADRNSVA